MSSRRELDSELEAILAEFSAYTPEPPKPDSSASVEPEPEEEYLPEPEIPMEYDPRRRRAVEESVRSLPRSDRPKPPEPEPEPPKPEPPVRKQPIRKQQPPKPEQPVRKQPQPVRQSPPPSPKPPKKRGVLARVGLGVVSVVFMLISVVVLSWVAGHVHPDSGTAAAASRPKLQLTDKVDVYMNNLASDSLGELSFIRKIYTIPESNTAAPKPNPANYGSVPIDRAAEVLPVIEQARATGLLDGQEVIFDPNAEFYWDSEIKYYCDETILVICWKELIDGNTCSCAEIKIADPSQFRRKIADDTFGSPNQYYASTLNNQVNAVVSMNADFYQFRNFGIVVYQRELYRYSDYNYAGNYSMYKCIDNCFVTADGDFLFMHKGDTISKEEVEQFIRDNNVLFSIAFGPILIENGEAQECTWYPAGEPTTGYSRAGIGIRDKLHYFYMSLNHSPEKSARWTVTEFANHMAEKGLQKAYGLDGGQTGELVFQGQPYNYIDFGAERLVSDIIYFGTALPDGEVTQ